MERFLLISLIVAVAFSRTGECCEIDEGYRRPHNDLNKGQKNIKNSPEECCEDCRNTDGCVAWVLTPKNQCWLKHTIGEKQADSGFYTGTMTRCEIEDGYRRPGNDLINGNNNIKNSAEECCEDCRNTDRCVAWTLTPRNRCWLKHTIGEKRAESGYQTGTITSAVTQAPPPPSEPPAVGCEIDEGYRRPHNDLNKGQKNIKNSPEECCEDCRNTDGCVAWVLTPKNQCWLKHTIGDKMADSGFYTGTMTRCEIEDGYRRPGNDLINGNNNIKNSAEECCEDCRNTDRCVAWTLTPKNRCWLKHTIGEKRAQSGYKTGTITTTQPPPPTEAPPPPPKTEPPPTEAPPPPPKTEPPPTEAPPQPPPKTESPAVGETTMIPTLPPCEFPSGLHNVAQGRPTAQSSDKSKKDSGSENAVDGDFNTDANSGSCSWTNKEYQPWWTVDLGETYDIYEVVITNRQDCCPFRLKNAEIRVGDSETFEDNPPCGMMILGRMVKENPVHVRCGCETPMRGRYVSIQLIDRTQMLTLCEVEVMVT